MRFPPKKCKKYKTHLNEKYIFCGHSAWVAMRYWLQWVPLNSFSSTPPLSLSLTWGSLNCLSVSSIPDILHTHCTYPSSKLVTLLIQRLPEQTFVCSFSFLSTSSLRGMKGCKGQKSSFFLHKKSDLNFLRNSRLANSRVSTTPITFFFI